MPKTDTYSVWPVRGGNPTQYPELSLDHLPPTWSQVLPASERFEEVMGGEAVLDKETGLVWTRQAFHAGGSQDWLFAWNYGNILSIAGRKGWRLPTIDELLSLLDMTQSNPALPGGYEDHFENVQNQPYWTSTTHPNCTWVPGECQRAYVVDVSDGIIIIRHKGNGAAFIWPVRGGK
ncbi:MAG: DUF1566 domain-containing protein [Planctomycetes bacterium]|nr:DUF1566 domain-containing protein [Planctomycetota bacterium]